MKKKVYFYSLLMTLVMMVASPTRVWAQEYGGYDSGYDSGDDPGDDPGYDSGYDPGYDPGDQQPQSECDMGNHHYGGYKYIGNGKHVEFCDNCGMTFTEEECSGNEDGRCEQCNSYMNYECTPSATVIRSSGSYPDEEAENLFDGNYNTKWCSSLTEGKFEVIFKPIGNEPKILKKYTLMEAVDTYTYPERSWSGWEIFGSNDDNLEEWTSINIIENTYSDGVYSTRSNTPYKYFKITINRDRSNTQQMGEMIIEWASVPTFDSLAELLANDPDYDAVNVTIDDEVMVAMLNPEGAYMVALKNNMVLLQAPAPDPALNWPSGGRVTGTLNNVSWNSLDNLLHSDDASLWSNLTYTPGVVKEYNSIEELLADDIEQGTTVSVKINNKIAAFKKMDAGMSHIVLEKANGEEGIGLIGLIGSDSDLEAGGNLSGTLTNVTYGLMNDVAPTLMALSTNILAVLDYKAPAGGSQSSDVATVTINGVETPYDGIQQALAAAKAASSATLTLLQDVTVQGTSLTFDAGNVTLDLNGKTLAIASEESPVLNISAGSLIITDSGENGEMKNTTGSFVLTVTGGNLTIHGGTFTSSTFTLDISGGTASLDGGKYISTNYGPAINNITGSSILEEGYLFYSITTDAELTENTNGIITAGRGPASQIIVKAAPAAPEVPTFASIQALLDANLASGTVVTVTVNGTIAGAGYGPGVYNVVLDNGFAIASMGVTSNPGWAAGGTVSGTLENVTFMRGEGEEGKEVVGVMSEDRNIFEDLTYAVPAPVATVTINGVETTYTDISDAFDAAVYGSPKTSTLKLLDDVEVTYLLPCYEGHDITIDLNGHKYISTLSDEDEYYAFEINDDAKLTVKNGTIISNICAFIVTENSSLNIFNCTVEAYGTGIWVNSEGSVVNIVNTNISSETNGAIYMAIGEVNLSGNCRFTPGSDWAPVFVDSNLHGVIKLDLGYMMVDNEGTKITSFKGNIGTHGQYVDVVADDAVAECAAGTHKMEHHDAVPATCTTTGKAEYWECTICQRYYADEEGNTRLPLGIIPDTPIAHNYVDGVCANCGSPIIVTAENYESLGLKAEHVGYYAIQNLANLAFFAEGFGSRITPATEPEVGEEIGGGVIEAPRRANRVNGNGQQSKTRRNAVRRVAGEQGDVLGFVLTDNIVVNSNLLDANGMPNDRDNNGNIRAGLLAWEPVELYCNECSELIFDGNGHTISGLYQNSPSEHNDLGFISYAGEGVVIKNLGITDSYFGSIMEGYNSSIGSIVCCSKANIENCWSDATIDVQNADHLYIGGLVGYLYAGNISDSYFSGRIMSSGANEVAGLVADISCYDDVTISNCHFSGSMSCKQGNIDYCGVAGLINYISAGDNNIVIERCYADGKIDAKGSNTTVSGLFCNQYTNGGTAIVRNNYNAMTVNAPSYYGLFDYAEGNGNISFNVNADKNASCPYSDKYIYGYFNISVADEENDYDDGFVIEVTEEQMASGAVAYMLNEWNKDIDPTEEETAPVWYQLIGEDAHPVLAGDEYSIVYCDDDEPTPASVFYNLARTLDTYAFVDATEYTIKSKTNVTELTYQRNVTETQAGKWQALYVPFRFPVAELKKAGFDVACINNFHEYTDENGLLIATELEIKMLTSGTLKENWPYLIRPAEAGTKEIVLENVTLAPAKENSISCSSIEREYTFSGTYSPMKELASNGYLFLNGGSLCTAANDDVTLKAQRWYLSIENKDSQLVDEPAVVEAKKRINISVIGEEDEATGIEEICVVSTKVDKKSAAGIYDIMGRKLNSMSKGINIIRDNNGKTKKVLVK